MAHRQESQSSEPELDTVSEEILHLDLVGKSDMSDSDENSTTSSDPSSETEASSVSSISNSEQQEQQSLWAANFDDDYDDENWHESEPQEPEEPKIPYNPTNTKNSCPRYENPRIQELPPHFSETYPGDEKYLSLKARIAWDIGTRRISPRSSAYLNFDLEFERITKPEGIARAVLWEMAVALPGKDSTLKENLIPFYGVDLLQVGDRWEDIEDEMLEAVQKVARDAGVEPMPVRYLSFLDTPDDVCISEDDDLIMGLYD